MFKNDSILISELILADYVAMTEGGLVAYGGQFVESAVINDSKFVCDVFGFDLDLKPCFIRIEPFATYHVFPTELLTNDAYFDLIAAFMSENQKRIFNMDFKTAEEIIEVCENEPVHPVFRDTLVYNLCLSNEDLLRAFFNNKSINDEFKNLVIKQKRH